MALFVVVHWKNIVTVRVAVSRFVPSSFGSVFAVVGWERTMHVQLLQLKDSQVTHPDIRPCPRAYPYPLSLLLSASCRKGVQRSSGGQQCAVAIPGCTTVSCRSRSVTQTKSQESQSGHNAGMWCACSPTATAVLLCSAPHGYHSDTEFFIDMGCLPNWGGCNELSICW